MTAWFGLAAPLFILDQCVHLTAPLGQGEFEEEGLSCSGWQLRGSFMADFKFYVCFSVLSQNVTFKFISWNVRGMVKLTKIKQVITRRKQLKSSIVFIYTFT